MGRGTHDYPNPVANPGPGPALVDREDSIASYEVGFRHRLNYRATLTARISHLERNSTVNTYDRSRNLYSLGMSYHF